MIPSDAQRFMAKRAGATVAEAKGSHAIYVSQPQVVTDVIAQAAEGGRSMCGPIVGCHQGGCRGNQVGSPCTCHISNGKLRLRRRPGSVSSCRIPVAMPVGSRTGAVFLRSSLAVSPRFLWECLSSQTVYPFPAPATSHPACGFPALGAPVCFMQRFMGPIVLERLSHLTIDRAGSC
jgi:hypothetical protein